jgi:hypothetical protein
MSERCCELSEAAGESLVATATTSRSWLLVEVPGAWSRDVGDDGVLPPAAHDAVTTWLAGRPGSRLLFVRRGDRRRRVDVAERAASGLLSFVVQGDEGRGEVRRLELRSHEDLVDADLDRDGALHDSSLVLVCGHGTRDLCCARRGPAVFASLAERLPGEELWISSHHGGHRFAANVLVLPAGLQFGRVEPGEAPSLVERALAGRIELVRYRGRSCYESAVQAAERAVREEAVVDGVDELRLVDAEDGIVRFRTWDGSEYAVSVEEVAGPSVPASCGAEAEPQRTFVATLL